MIVSFLSSGSPLKLAFMPLWHAPIFFFFSTSLLFCITRGSRFMLYISCPSLGIGHFSEQFWIRPFLWTVLDPFDTTCFNMCVNTLWLLVKYYLMCWNNLFLDTGLTFFLFLVCETQIVIRLLKFYMTFLSLRIKGLFYMYIGLEESRLSVLE